MSFSLPAVIGTICVRVIEGVQFAFANAFQRNHQEEEEKIPTDNMVDRGKVK